LQNTKKGLEFNSIAQRLHLFAGLLHQRLSGSHSRDKYERSYRYY
jgi:hypothetical protein